MYLSKLGKLGTRTPPAPGTAVCVAAAAHMIDVACPNTLKARNKCFTVCCPWLVPRLKSVDEQGMMHQTQDAMAPSPPPHPPLHDAQSMVCRACPPCCCKPACANPSARSPLHASRPGVQQYVQRALYWTLQAGSSPSCSVHHWVVGGGGGLAAGDKPGCQPPSESLEKLMPSYPNPSQHSTSKHIYTVCPYQISSLRGQSTQKRVQVDSSSTAWW